MRKALALLLLLLSFAAVSLACQPVRTAPGAPPLHGVAQSLRQPAPVFGHEHAEWLERPGREAAEKPDEVIDAMHLHRGSVVAEIGAGTGFFSRRIAHSVGPKGRIYAEDIQPEMLDLLQKYAGEEGISNVVSVLGTTTDPKLPKGQMDWFLLVDVYHEFQEPAPMLAKIRDALKPGGRVALVEYRAEDDTASHISPPHRMSVEQILKEWEPAGFQLVERIETLPSQHMLIFTVRSGTQPR